jgi:hypothetical protein
MILGLEIGLIIVGILALVRGRIQLSKGKTVQGAPARLLGLLALTPLPVAFFVIMVYTLANTDINRPDLVEKWAEDNKWTLTAIEAGVVIGIGVLFIILVAVMGKPVAEVEREVRKKRVADYDDEFEDDRPRRRRAAEYDEGEDDRPHRRRDEYDADDDRRPRRRRDEE